MIVKTGVKFRDSDVLLDLSNRGPLDEDTIRDSVMEFQRYMNGASQTEEVEEPSEEPPEASLFNFDPSEGHLK